MAKKKVNIGKGRNNFVLKNPFQPTGIVSMPGEFFGRIQETQRLERALTQGSVIITGAMGAGKSSLLAHSILQMEGFNSNNKKTVKARAVMAVGDKDINTVDDVARLVLEELVQIDEKQQKFTVKIPKVDCISWQSTKTWRFFQEGRHRSALTTILKEETLNSYIRENTELFILAFDEVDKCPEAIASFIKALDTSLGHEGINSIRYIAAGISPFYEAMLKEASGVERIFYDTLPVLPFQDDEASELLNNKFTEMIKDARVLKEEIEIDPIVTELILKLSGNLPQLIQLLGSYVVEHENNDPDNKIDSRDLMGALQAICYDKRGRYYSSMLHQLELDGVLESFKRLLFNIEPTMPTVIERSKAREIVEDEMLLWLVEHDIISPVGEKYRLNDELLRVRINMDEKEEPPEETERKLLTRASFEEGHEMWPESWQEKEYDDFE